MLIRRSPVTILGCGSGEPPDLSILGRALDSHFFADTLRWPIACALVVSAPSSGMYTPEEGGFGVKLMVLTLGDLKFLKELAHRSVQC
jgi:hypothetical protein